MTSVADFEYKLVVVTRRNLKLSPGKLSVQAAHASVSCALKAKEADPRTFRAWFEEGQKKVVVRAQTERELHELRMAADGLGLATALIQDAGMTEIPPGTVTVLGIGPGRADVVDQVTGQLPLL